MIALHDIPTRLVLVASRYGGFFGVRTIGLGEHMAATTFEDRMAGLKEAISKEWLVPTRGDNNDRLSAQWFVGEVGVIEVLRPSLRSLGLEMLHTLYPPHYISNPSKAEFDEAKRLFDLHRPRPQR